MPEEEMTCKAAGKLGGAKRKAALGSAGYSAIGKKGGATTKARHGAEHYREIGKSGGDANALKYGSEHFRELGRKGGAKVAELIAAGKAAKQEEAEEHLSELLANAARELAGKRAKEEATE
jgi:general stress protein YciG